MDAQPKEIKELSESSFSSSDFLPNSEIFEIDIPQNISEKYNSALNFEKGMNHHTKNIDKAIEIYKSIEKDHIMSKYRLGVCYAKKGNLQAAFNQYFEAAKHDLPLAYSAIGQGYLKGVLREKTIQKKPIKPDNDTLKHAITYFLLALKRRCLDCKEDFIKAIHLLCNNLETIKDYDTQNTYWNYGSLYDDAESCFQLAISHFKGRGMEKNEQKSLIFLKKAAELGHVEAQFKMGEHYEKQKKLSLATEYYKKAASQKHPKAHCALGFFYEMGLGNLEFSPQRANRYYIEADNYANQPGFSYFLLAQRYETGLSTIANLQKATVYCTKAVEQGYPHAQQKLNTLNESCGKQNQANYFRQQQTEKDLAELKKQMNEIRNLMAELRASIATISNSLRERQARERNVSLLPSFQNFRRVLRSHNRQTVIQDIASSALHSASAPLLDYADFDMQTSDNAKLK